MLKLIHKAKVDTYCQFRNNSTNNKMLKKVNI